MQWRRTLVTLKSRPRGAHVTIRLLQEELSTSDQLFISHASRVRIQSG